MLFWFLVIIVSAVCCAALFYAGRMRPVNGAAPSEADADRDHHRQLLSEVERDLNAGRISEPDAIAAKSELAREVLRVRSEHDEHPVAINERLRQLPAFATIAATLLGVGLYAFLGNPSLPGVPLVGREPPPQAQMSIEEAIAKVEAQLKNTPDDVRGWRVLAPIYMRAGRNLDAIGAYRRILELQPPTSDALTDLAEALIVANNGSAQGEALSALQQAHQLDPGHQRSLFYLANEATQSGDFERAVKLWTDLIATTSGSEDWLTVAQQGLDAALKGEAGMPAGPAASGGADQQEMIAGMVEGLSARLESDGGSIEEWTRLVRSRLVLGQIELAQKAYEAAKIAFPDAAVRGELDRFASENKLD